MSNITGEQRTSISFCLTKAYVYGQILCNIRLTCHPYGPFACTQINQSRFSSCLHLKLTVQVSRICAAAEVTLPKKCKTLCSSLRDDGQRARPRSDLLTCHCSVYRQKLHQYRCFTGAVPGQLWKVNLGICRGKIPSSSCSSSPLGLIN